MNSSLLNGSDDFSEQFLASINVRMHQHKYVKSVLKTKVQQRRLANGEEEVDCKTLFFNQNKKLSPIDVEKDEKRKEQNRLSAQRSRQKKKEVLDGLAKENKKLVKENAKLKEEYSSLESNKNVLKTFLTTHEVHCCHTTFVGQAHDDDSVYDVESIISDDLDTVSPPEPFDPEEDYLSHDDDTFLDHQDICRTPEKRSVIAQETGKDSTHTDFTPDHPGHNNYNYISKLVAQQSCYQTPILVDSVSPYISMQASPLSVICKNIGIQESAYIPGVSSDDRIQEGDKHINSFPTDLLEEQNDREFKSGGTPIIGSGYNAVWGNTVKTDQVGFQNDDSSSETVNEMIFGQSRAKLCLDGTLAVKYIGNTSVLNNDNNYNLQIVNDVYCDEKHEDQSLGFDSRGVLTSDAQNKSPIIAALSNTSFAKGKTELSLQAAALLPTLTHVNSTNACELDEKLDLALAFLKSEGFINDGSFNCEVSENVNIYKTSTQDDFDVSPLSFEDLNDFTMLVPNLTIDHPIPPDEQTLGKMKRSMKSHHAESPEFPALKRKRIH